MKTLPYEGRASRKQQGSPEKSGKKLRPKQNSNMLDPKTNSCRIEIKKISQRLKAYAEGANVPDAEVLRLLEDTRGQVIRMRVARDHLSKNPQNKNTAKRRNRR